MKYHAKVVDKKIEFSTSVGEAMFMERHEGKKILIEADEAITSEIRRFFEGAIIPYIFYQHAPGSWENYRDCREAIKMEFRPMKTVDIHGKPAVGGEPTGGKSKKWFQRFIDDIIVWMEENQYELPDSENYLRWIDEESRIDAVYPPLLRLKETYQRKIDENLPVWRK